MSRPPARRASGTEGLLPQEMEGLVGGANAADGASDQRLAPTSTEAGLGEVGANGAGPQSCARRSRSFHKMEISAWLAEFDSGDASGDESDGVGGDNGPRQAAA